jgi:hypothetical protein
MASQAGGPDEQWDARFPTRVAKDHDGDRRLYERLCGRHTPESPQIGRDGGAQTLSAVGGTIVWCIHNRPSIGCARMRSFSGEGAWL